jgi:D-alanyl-D-alanine dipeptidase
MSPSQAFAELSFRSNRPTSNAALRLGLLLWFVLVSGCAFGPPDEHGEFRDPDLVELVTLDPTLHLDIRYATANNFTSHPLYTEARAFLQRPAAEALVRAHRSLRPEGYGILVFDAYRPWSVTEFLWDSASESDRKHKFVADPEVGSIHNRGCAVDVSLYDLKTGRPVEMPSQFDEFSERAYPTYRGGPAEARALRDLLRKAMEAQGFQVSNEEWWHFDYRDWAAYRLLDVPFEEIGEIGEVEE